MSGGGGVTFFGKKDVSPVAAGEGSALARELAGIVSSELDRRMAEQTAQLESKMKAMMEQYQQAMLSVFAASTTPRGRHYAPTCGGLQNLKLRQPSTAAVAKEQSLHVNRASEQDRVEAEETRLKQETRKREQFMAKFSADEIYGMSASSSHKTKRVQQHMPQDSSLGKLGDMINWLMPRLLIQPGSTFRMWWDMISMALAFYIAVLLPYRIAFVRDWTLSNAIFDLLTDLYFIADFILNFFTCYFHDGILIDSYPKIARHYLRTWLIPDLIASTPFDWFVHGVQLTPPDPVALVEDAAASETVLLLRVLKIVRLLRLLRVARLARYLHRWETHFTSMDFFNSNWLRLAKVISIMAFFSHWNGCFQYMLATFEATLALEVDPETGLNTTVLHFQPSSWVRRLQNDGIMDEDNAWSWSFFNAITQMLAISIGVKEPQRQIELWGYMISVLLGATLYGFFVASLTTAISEADASAKDYRTKLDMVNQYMVHSRLPKELRSKLRTYFELRFPSKRSFDEDGILSEISMPLRQEICLHKCRAVLSTLQVLDSGDRSSTRPQLKDAGLPGAISQQLERVVYVRGDHIIREGEEPEGMYFVSQGQVEVISTFGDVLSVLGPSSFFGEMALLNPEGRAVASIRVRSYCEGYRLSRDAYDKIVFIYPSFKEYLESVAKLRLRSKQGKQAGKDADLATMLESLNPVKRKLMEQEKKKKKKEDSDGTFKNTQRQLAKKVMEQRSTNAERKASLGAEASVSPPALPRSAIGAMSPASDSTLLFAPPGGGRGGGSDERKSGWRAATLNRMSRASSQERARRKSEVLEPLTEEEEGVIEEVARLSVAHIVPGPEDEGSEHGDDEEDNDAHQGGVNSWAPPWKGLGGLDA
jgi:CRP-like cAMP-binding protein